MLDAVTIFFSIQKLYLCDKVAKLEVNILCEFIFLSLCLCLYIIPFTIFALSDKSFSIYEKEFTFINGYQNLIELSLLFWHFGKKKKKNQKFTFKVINYYGYTPLLWFMIAWQKYITKDDNKNPTLR